MRDRFPLLLVGALLLAGFATSFLIKGAARGDFADVLSTYRADPEGSRAIFLLAQESGLPVDRLRTDLTILDPRAALALIGIDFASKDSAKETLEDFLGKLDGGSEESDEAEAKKGFAGLSYVKVDTEEREKLLEHIKKGQTLIYVTNRGHVEEDPLLEDLKVKAWKPEDAPGVRTLVPAQPSPYTVGVHRLEAKVHAVFGLPADALPLLLDQYSLNVVAARVPYGQGAVIVIGAPELAMNQALARADNAQFWLSTLEAAAGTGTVLIDEFHHGFSDDRSIAEFARRYGLHFAAIQLLLGLCLWAGSLRRFGRPRKPVEDERVGATDALFAQSRLYREGKHQAFAAQLIANGLTQELAPLAGESARAQPAQIAAGLTAHGREDLARSLGEVVERAAAVHSETDLQKMADLAARTRQRMKVRILSTTRAEPAVQRKRAQ